MTRFVEQAITRAGLLPVLTARRAGDVEAVRANVSTWQGQDLLALGALADLIREEEEGVEVRIHDGAKGDGVMWVSSGGSELDVLRAVAVTRITAPAGARVGIDWGRYGLELSQVALGFGATDLRGPITRKSGLPILDEETKKVKGQGMVDLKDLQRQEIAALVTYAGRQPVFVFETAEDLRDAATKAVREGRDKAEVAGA